jgi:hypothetical protein
LYKKFLIVLETFATKNIERKEVLAWHLQSGIWGFFFFFLNKCIQKMPPVFIEKYVIDNERLCFVIEYIEKEDSISVIITH